MDKNQALEIYSVLISAYPEAKTALAYKKPLDLLIATVLSAQSTDKQVNKVTKNLFRKYTSPENYARANLRELEEDIKSTGFYRKKARYLIQIGKTLVKDFNSKVPETMEQLVTLLGVARKTANIVLSNAFGIIEGIAVDTHVQRLSKRIGFSKNTNPNNIEKDLMKLFPRENWSKLSNLLILHGRRICSAKKPNCAECTLNHLCHSAFKI